MTDLEPAIVPGQTDADLIALANAQYEPMTAASGFWVLVALVLAIILCWLWQAEE